MVEPGGDAVDKVLGTAHVVAAQALIGQSDEQRITLTQGHDPFAVERDRQLFFGGFHVLHMLPFIAAIGIVLSLIPRIDAWHINRSVVLYICP